MKALMAGEQGRAWLTRGALRDASIARRFDRHVDAMATDALLVSSVKKRGVGSGRG